MRVSPVNLLTLAYAIDVEGHDAQAVLRRCGMGPGDQLREDGEWVPVESFDRMMKAAIDATNDPHFGLVVGKSIALMKYNVIMSLAMSAPSLRQILEDIERFAPLVVPRSELELIEEGSSARIVVRPVICNGASGHFRCEQVAMSTVQLLRFTGAVAADIRLVTFPYKVAEEQVSRYGADFGPFIEFLGQECSVTFNPELLDRPLALHDPVANMSARARAEALLTAQNARCDLAEKIRQWVLSILPYLPSAAETARHIGVNERTLRRQLKEMKTSHTGLIEEARRLITERLLADGQQPLKQIAHAAGFASVQSFHRAFRRWSGMSPSEWRAAHAKA